VKNYKYKPRQKNYLYNKNKLVCKYAYEMYESIFRSKINEEEFIAKINKDGILRLE